MPRRLQQQKTGGGPSGASAGFPIVYGRTVAAALSQHPLLTLALQAGHMGEDPVPLQQLGGRALLGHGAAGEHHDLT